MEDTQKETRLYLRGSGFNASFAAFWLFLAIMIIFFFGTPDFHDILRYKLLTGSPEKQEIVWNQVVQKLEKSR